MSAQHMEAFALAQMARLRRAEVRARLRSLPPREAAALAARIVRNPELAVRTMAVFDLLRVVPNYGRERVVRLLTKAGVPERKPLEELTERQREAVANGLRLERGT